MHPVLSPLLLSLLLAGATPQTWYVPDDFATIQAALDGVAPGDTVIVRPNTYFEAIDFKGKAVHLRSEKGPAVTTIDGQGAWCVALFVSGEGPGAILEGFTLKGGVGHAGLLYSGGITVNGQASPVIRGNVVTGNTGIQGGGIGVRSGSPTIVDNHIHGNTASDYGGGIGCYISAAPVIEGNLIEGNDAPNVNSGGGGVGTSNFCSLTLSRNVIRDNTCAGRGGGVYATYTTSLLSGNLIAGNTASQEGGGVYLGAESYHVLLADDVVVGNTSGLSGGGVMVFNCVDTTIINCTVADNQALGAYPNGRGGGLSWSGSTGAAYGRITNSVFWGNSAAVSGQQIYAGLPFTPSFGTIEYSCVQGGQSGVHWDGSVLVWGSGMLATDPLFVDAAKGDYHLPYTSPCRDVGDSLALYLPLIDMEGDPRIAGAAVDMGADEFHTHLYTTGDHVPGGTVSLKVVGAPATNPVALFLGGTVLPAPLPTVWGSWHLGPPILGPFFLLPIPASGVEIMTAALPGTVPGPYSVGLQAIVGAELTNLHRLEVE